MSSFTAGTAGEDPPEPPNPHFGGEIIEVSSSYSDLFSPYRGQFTSFRPRALDPYEVLRRPVIEPRAPSDGDPTASTDEPLVLDYGTDEPPTDITIYDAAELESAVGDASPVVGEGDPVSADTTSSPQPSLEHAPAIVSGPSLERATEASTDAPVVVHDSDPPFMTDGRGRVVWSSTTASRGRRRRTSTSISGSAPGLHRDEPRDAPSSNHVPGRSPERK